MKFKTNYLFIPLVTITVALLGNYFTSLGMEWYDNELLLPNVVPAKWAFPLAWTSIFITSTISALILWNQKKHKNTIASIFTVNAMLNVFWTYLFFVEQAITGAFIEMILLELTVIALMSLSWNISRTASLLLLPYMAWVAFATYITYLIILVQ